MPVNNSKISPVRRKRHIFKVIKYTVLSLLGVVLFMWAHKVATADRGYVAFGGECFFLLLPLLWWLLGTIIRDFAHEIISSFKG